MDESDNFPVDSGGLTPGLAGRPRRTGVSTWRAVARALVIALKDLSHDRRTTAVLVFTGAAIIAPLLLLFGLKNGVVWTLRDGLLQQPANLEVVVYGNTALKRNWFERYAVRDDVAFVVPKTRTINATLDLVNARRRFVSAVEVIPTASGDPLLPDGLPLPTEPGQVLVTETLAAKLDLPAAGPLSAVVRRNKGGLPQHARFELAVIGTVPETSLARDALFTTPDLLVAAEDYRDGLLDAIASTPAGLERLAGLANAREQFSNARIYANGLDAVAPLADAMRADGIEVRTRAERIATVQAFDRLLSFIFRVIAVIGVIGCTLALGGALWVNVDRKRRNLALLRLIGFGNGAVTVVPVVQSIVITMAGFALAFAVYLVGAGFFNQVLGENLGEGAYACRLAIGDVVAAAGIAFAVGLVAGAAGGVRARRIAPAESLREV